MKKHHCNMCSYTYDPEKGHLPSGVKSNTEWEDVPEDWRCPVCGAVKKHFTEED